MRLRGERTERKCPYLFAESLMRRGQPLIRHPMGDTFPPRGRLYEPSANVGRARGRVKTLPYNFVPSRFFLRNLCKRNELPCVDAAAPLMRFFDGYFFENDAITASASALS